VSEKSRKREARKATSEKRGDRARKEEGERKYKSERSDKKARTATS
jgi:hypothetical protein